MRVFLIAVALGGLGLGAAKPSPSTQSSSPTPTPRADPSSPISPSPTTGGATNSGSSAAWTSFPTLKPGEAPSIPNYAPLPTGSDATYSSYSLSFFFGYRPTPAWGAFWSYSQPPIPSTATTVAGSQFTASFSEKEIHAKPQVREYTFNMTYAAGWPSGYLRRMAVINNQFPGPLIEANKGDTIVVHVHNHLDTGQSIHWHGIRQKNSNPMDGVPGFSQCPIQPGKNFTYRFQVPDEVGTFWYHSHFGNTLADGLVGGIVIHSPDDPLKRGRDYDEDHVVYLSDWMNDDSAVIIHEEHDMRKPYRNVTFVAEPDAALINGIGQTDCTRATRGIPCGINTPAEIVGARGKRLRLRLINTGGQGLIRFSIDNHVLKVIEADESPIVPVEVREIPVGSGQRYSVVVTLNQDKDDWGKDKWGDWWKTWRKKPKKNVSPSFWMRARVGTFCINPFSIVNGVGILRYSPAKEKGGKLSTDHPTTNPWPDLKIPNKAQCNDLDLEVPLAPLVPEKVPVETSGAWQADTLFGVFTHLIFKTPMIGFGMNGIMWRNMINDPLLQRVFEDRPLPDTKFNDTTPEIASVTFDGEGAADIILNVLDPPPIGHPFHLHGRPFFIIARGTGILTPGDIPNVKKNLVNPLKRDTLLIPQHAWALIRVKLDTPGVWPLHCHIGWHLAAGKMAAVTIGSHSVKTQNQPEDWKALCHGLDRTELGPG